MARRSKVDLNFGFWAGVVIALVFATPILAVAWLAFNPVDNIWPHLAATVLPRQVRNTSLLMAGNAAGCAVIGMGTAWLVTMCRFPGRRFFEWGLLLPMAMPAYVIAFVYTDLLEYAGPVQGALRQVFGWQSARDYWFPEIRSMGGAWLAMSLVLYTYVYMMVRAALLEQSVSALEVSRTLGRGPWLSFATVALPLLRPALVIGVVLVLMETLNDFGTVDFFAINTLTMGVFNVWLNMGNAGGAAQISLVMLIAVAGLIGLERWARRGRRYVQGGGRAKALPGTLLTGPAKWLAVTACGLPIAFGFVLPALVLARYAATRIGDILDGDYYQFVFNSLTLSGTAAVAAVAIAMILAYGARLQKTAQTWPGRIMTYATRLASVGYAVPGAVLALGVLIPFAAFDNAVDAFFRDRFGVSTGLILSGTIVAVIFAYVVRFLAVAYGGIEAALGRISPSMDMAARSLGAAPARTLLTVHLPMIRTSMLAAGVLVFVDGMKELPATLLLRPFGFETLATHVYQFASAELLAEASLSALTIAAAGVLPVFFLSRAISAGRAQAQPRARPGGPAAALPA
ncbi:MAG: iron ABC transporter permease [Alphaproteobacteria bacterium]|nr:iron ABC transporter permease [Alphaproteobacteria bacterium]MCZ6765079.1 iron ABC transporter permease [Alphaproteobacteria bacterium]